MVGCLMDGLSDYQFAQVVFIAPYISSHFLSFFILS
jgi:hypothetical protein